MDFGEDTLFANQGTGEIGKKMSKQGDVLIKQSISVVIILLIGGTSMVAIPVYEYLFKNGKPLFFPIILPFVDPDTDLGFIVNACNGIGCLSIGVPSLLGVEICMTIPLCSVQTAAHKVASNLNDLVSYYGPGMSEVKQKVQLKNILVQIQDVDK